MSMLKRIEPAPSLDHYNNTTDSFLITLVREMRENPDYDKITLLFKAAANRISTEQQSPFAKNIAERIAENREENVNWPETPDQARSMLDRCLAKYTELYPPLEMPVYAIVRNEKGLCEKNYIYTREQMEEFDPESLRECDARGIAEGGFWGNDTYTVSIIEDPAQLRDFLLGSDNHPSLNYENDDYLETLEDFYWESRSDCMFTGKDNPTMAQAKHQFKLIDKDLRGRMITDELALDTGKGYVEIHRTDGGMFDYSIYDKTFNLMDGGVIENENMTLVGVYREIEDQIPFKTRYPIDVSPEWLAEKVSYNDTCRIELINRGFSDVLHNLNALVHKYPDLISVNFSPSSINIGTGNSVRNPMSNISIVADDIGIERVKIFISEPSNNQYASKKLTTKAMCTDIADMVSKLKVHDDPEVNDSILARLYSKEFYNALENGEGKVMDYDVSEAAYRTIQERKYTPEPEKTHKKSKIEAEISH